MSKKIKVLAWSDGPTTTTGFGRVAREVLTSIHKTGKYDITSIGINYFGNTPITTKDNMSSSDRDIKYCYENFELIPAKFLNSNDWLGIELFLSMLKSGDYDVVWILQDAFNVAPISNKIIELKAKKGFKVIYYFPIDAENFAPEYFNSTRIADAVVTYNDWSRKIISNTHDEELGNRLSTIYHGFNPEDFNVISDNARMDFRNSFFQGKVAPDDILILRSDSNQQRKDYFKTLQIVAEVAEKNKKVKLFVNCKVNSKDFPLYYLAKDLGLVPGQNFFYLSEATKFYNLSQHQLNQLYNAADIGISTSRGEGCGLFHYEMMSLGKPMLISNTTAHKEAINSEAALGINCGYNAKGEYDPNLWQVLANDVGTVRSVCDVKHGVEQLKRLVKDIDLRRSISNNALEFMKDLSWEKVNKRWVELFASVANKETTFVYKTSINKLNNNVATHVVAFQEKLRQKIEEARTEFEEEYHMEPPMINYIGSNDEQNKK